MSSHVLLDTGPLSLATNPRYSPEAEQVADWIQSLVSKGTRIVVPEIADYELRRELLRAEKLRGIRRLDDLKDAEESVDYLPITTACMLRAARFWAECRKQGKPTADDKDLDGDVILAAQASLLLDEGKDAVIATTNVAHLSMFVPAKKWSEIG